MKAIIEVMESNTPNLYFIIVKIPQDNAEDGPEFATFVDKTHTTIQIACIGEPKIKYTAEKPIHSVMNDWNTQDFMKSTFKFKDWEG